MQKPMTETQRRIFDLIHSFVADKGYPPTRKEIAGLMGFASPNAAEEHVKALARKGYINVAPGISRGIQIRA